MRPTQSVLVCAVLAATGCASIDRLTDEVKDARLTIADTTSKFEERTIDLQTVLNDLPLKVEKISGKVSADLKAALLAASQEAAAQTDDVLRRNITLFTLKNFVFGYDKPMKAAQVPSVRGVTHSSFVCPCIRDAPITIEWRGRGLRLERPSVIEDLARNAKAAGLSPGDTWVSARVISTNGVATDRT